LGCSVVASPHPSLPTHFCRVAAPWRKAALERRLMVAIKYGMATSMIKSTYSLDAQTIQELEQLAHIWHVPKSEVIRRAIHQAARPMSQTSADARLKALKELQQRLKERRVDFGAWKRQIREARR